MKKTILAMLIIALFIGMAFTTVGTDSNRRVINPENQELTQPSDESRPIITAIMWGDIVVESYKPGRPFLNGYLNLDITGTVADPGSPSRPYFGIGHLGLRPIFWIPEGTRVNLKVFFLNHIPHLEVGEECGFGWSRGIFIRVEVLE